MADSTPSNAVAAAAGHRHRQARSPTPDSDYSEEFDDYPPPRVPLLGHRRALRNPNNPENQFHLFSRLPRELRNMIWKEALPHPRILTIFRTLDGYTLRSAPHLPLLMVSKEAREEGLRFYKLIRLRPSGPSFSKTYRIDPSRDYFWLRVWISDRMCHPNSQIRIEGVKRLIIHAADWLEIWTDEGSTIFSILRTSFPDVNEVTILGYNYSRYKLPNDIRPDKIQLIPVAPDHKTYYLLADYAQDYKKCGPDIIKSFVDRRRNFPDERIPILKFAIMAGIDEDEEKQTLDVIEDGGEDGGERTRNEDIPEGDSTIPG